LMQDCTVRGKSRTLAVTLKTPAQNQRKRRS